MYRLLPLLLALFILPLTVQAEVRHIDNGELREAIAAGIKVIDIRRDDEWLQTGVIEGSHLLTFFDREGKYDIGEWLSGFRKVVGPDEPVILICRTGNRTRAVTTLLDEQVGQAGVHNVASGITRWIADGNPVVAPAGEQ